MKGIVQFEDLECWQSARELCIMVIEMTNKETFSKDFRFVSQIKASSGSGMDNIAEGFERGGNREYIQFLYIAKGSLGETRSQLYRAFENNYIASEELEAALEIALKASRQTQNLIKSLNQSNYRGHKYK